ncbi:MAG: tyrosine--tRNA ligase [Dehalococcoidia bacterium]|nr:tyrosine--tRNA ligase [Dehalococcoidia bacterium]MSQ17358.1 tyrosine--tRNA ligase [Dehalococcoidia bacterium]
MLSQSEIQRIVRRGVREIISETEFVAMLQSGRPLRLKMGFDPSRPDIHLGHVVGLRKLRQLQELGHQVILIVGDWTAQIGDPSGQSVTRPMLTHEEVKANAESYLRQFFKVVDRDRTQVEWQSQWFGKFTLADVIRLTSRFTVAQFLERDDFAQRFREHRPIAITELMYPLLQAYDSVAIQSDVEFGGSDQKFNLLVGRQLQEMLGQTPQQCFLMPLLVGTDGVHKMSKSLGNYVAVEEPPNDMYGKLMSLPDALIAPYFEYLTGVPDEELAEMSRSLAEHAVNPMELKKRLAWDITRQFHDSSAADAAQAHFERVVQRRDIPEDIPEVPWVARVAIANLTDDAGAPIFGAPVFDAPIFTERSSTGTVRWSTLLVNAKLSTSTSAAKRLIRQGAVDVIYPSGESTTIRTDGPSPEPDPEYIIKVGKLGYRRVVP